MQVWFKCHCALPTSDELLFEFGGGGGFIDYAVRNRDCVISEPFFRAKRFGKAGEFSRDGRAWRAGGLRSGIKIYERGDNREVFGLSLDEAF